jgi:ABC-type uncharacterized transport system auxiliary subunit
MEKMKPALIVATLALSLLTSCTTIQNRRDLYSPQTVEGPYTRMLKDGSWRKPKPAEAQEAPSSQADGSSSRDSKEVKPPVAG